MTNGIKDYWFFLLLCFLPLTFARAECFGETWTPHDRFEINGSEVVDKDTGLVWKRCPEGFEWSGATCSGHPEKMTWDYAMEKYKSSGKGWRLPNKDELATLRAGDYYKKVGCWLPAINARIFPGEGQDSWFWTSSPYVKKSSDAWYVHSGNGLVFSFSKLNEGSVRLVREK